MSTRSILARQTADAIEAIYCHYDGTPAHHMPILTANYADDHAVAELLALGDISSLGAQIGSAHPFSACPADECHAYGRDRGDAGTAPERIPDEAALLARADQRWACFIYLYRDGQWLYRSIADRSWQAA